MTLVPATVRTLKKYKDAKNTKNTKNTKKMQKKNRKNTKHKCPSLCREVYNLANCAEFVSNFLRYEPLERPTELPSCLPSPGQVIAKADSDTIQ